MKILLLTFHISADKMRPMNYEQQYHFISLGNWWWLNSDLP